METWKETILKADNTMQDAISVLDKVETKIIMVSDNSRKLIGTITDGDIRRALINQLGMEEKLSKFMFKEPSVALENDSESYILSIMRDRGLRQIPILDNDRRIIGLRSEKGLRKRQTRDNPVFLMAGGFGTRLKPLTNSTPKPLLNVSGKPILEIIIDQFIEAGFHIFYISIHYKADMFEQYFGDGRSLGVSIKYVYESSPLGTAGALSLMPPDLPDLPVIVMNGDLLTKINLEELLLFHNHHEAAATMAVRDFNFQVPYGVVEIEDNKIKSLSEKPTQHFFINAGIYVLSRSLIRTIDKDKHLDMTTLLTEQLEKKENVAMFPIHEHWLDIGQHEQLEQAQSDSKIFYNLE